MDNTIRGDMTMLKTDPFFVCLKKRINSELMNIDRESVRW